MRMGDASETEFRAFRDGADERLWGEAEQNADETLIHEGVTYDRVAFMDDARWRYLTIQTYIMLTES